MYKATPKDYAGIKYVEIIRFNNDGSITSIPTDVSNTDYQQFKTDVLAGAVLEDADGVPMSQADADAFIATLP